MAEEDAETCANELQVAAELPVIQLCGLVEELRYRPAGCAGRPLLTVWPRTWVQHGDDQVRIEPWGN